MLFLTICEYGSNLELQDLMRAFHRFNNYEYLICLFTQCSAVWSRECSVRLHDAQT